MEFLSLPLLGNPTLVSGGLGSDGDIDSASFNPFPIAGLGAPTSRERPKIHREHQTMIIRSLFSSVRLAVAMLHQTSEPTEATLRDTR